MLTEWMNDRNNQKSKDDYVKIGLIHDTGCLGLVHWDDPEGWYGEGGGRREEGSGCRTHVYLWWIHVDIWQNQYNIVKLKKKIPQKKF